LSAISFLRIARLFFPEKIFGQEQPESSSQKQVAWKKPNSQQPKPKPKKSKK
jgi:hypothetical protein